MKDKHFTYIPEITVGNIDQTAAYLHITTNNTIEGTAFQTIPDAGKVPIVADVIIKYLGQMSIV